MLAGQPNNTPRADFHSGCAFSEITCVCRLVFNDAATYDAATGTGGVDGSVVLNKEEKNRPENKGLSDYVQRLGKAKV
jgi:hypothetical protein